jgi:recombinational DNA repair protein (RecF pathway)
LITKHDDQFITAIEKDNVLIAFITRKEQADIKLAIKLRKNGVIITLKDLFERSQQQEINGLITREVFEFIQYNLNKHLGVRIFNSRLVNKVKGKATNSLFKKSRLVV